MEAPRVYTYTFSSRFRFLLGVGRFASVPRAFSAHAVDLWQVQSLPKRERRDHSYKLTSLELTLRYQVMTLCSCNTCSVILMPHCFSFIHIAHIFYFSRHYNIQQVRMVGGHGQVKSRHVDSYSFFFSSSSSFSSNLLLFLLL